MNVKQIPYGTQFIANWVWRISIGLPPPRKPQLYFRHRQEPVPYSGRIHHGRVFRHPYTNAERGAYFEWLTTAECLRNKGITIRYRPARKPPQLPTAYADLDLIYQRNWKRHRKTQWKQQSINRQVHAPPYWS